MPTKTFRAGPNLLIAVSLFAFFFLMLGFHFGINKHDWTVLAVVVVVFALLLLLLSRLRLSFTPNGFDYRNLSGSSSILFSDVQSAGFEVLRAQNAPQGVAAFSVQLNDGRSLKINLRTFSTEAAAILFTSLEARHIKISVPDEWAAQRVMEQVRAAQEKYLGIELVEDQ